MTQILSLANLVGSIQKKILGGNLEITERAIRRIASEVDWEIQAKRLADHREEAPRDPAKLPAAGP